MWGEKMLSSFFKIHHPVTCDSQLRTDVSWVNRDAGCYKFTTMYAFGLLNSVFSCTQVHTLTHNHTS